MSKTTMAAALVTLLAAGTAMADDQPATNAPPSPRVRAAMTANHLLPGQIRASEMNGAAVHDTENRNIGEIRDIVLGNDGRVAAVILQVGGTLGVGGRYVAVGIGDLEIAERNTKPRFSVDMTKEQLRTAQTYSLDEVAETESSTPPKDR
jgi:hypothetical protein